MTDELYYEGRRVYVSGGYPAVSWRHHPLGQPNYPLRVHLAEWYKHHGAPPAGFVIHHKDEDRWNWSIDNLQLMTDTAHREHHARQRGGKPAVTLSCEACGAEIVRKACDVYGARNFCSHACHDRSRPGQITWPALDELLKMVQKSGYCATGRTLGVSDNAVRKHLKKHQP